MTSRDDEEVVGEHRWPMAAALIAAIVLTILLPDELRLGPRWLIPSIEAVLLVALIIRDPGRIDRVNRSIRWLSLVLLALLVGQALWATGVLLHGLVIGVPQSNDADFVLEAGTLVWFSNNIAFALLYWELDGGGAAGRAHRMPAHPDLAFVQQINPDLAPLGWRPRFLDYLYLGFTNALAFSPTDVMPLTWWPKVVMTMQSLLSLAIIGLVIARAVNAFK